jgi:hypothetical protein
MMKKALLHHHQTKRAYYIKIQSTGNCGNYSPMKYAYKLVEYPLLAA